MKSKLKKLLTTALALCMLLSMVPTGMITVNAAPITQNQNSGDGVMLRKSATPHEVEGVPDGTVDITIDAYTTGEVVSKATVIPSDIVLVLDVSGSMDDNYTVATSYSYTAANGTRYQTGFGFNRTTYYGFATGTSYFVQTGTDTYTQLTRRGNDSGSFIYYSYTDSNGVVQYVYPIMASGIDYEGEEREYDYSQVQFYTRTAVTTTKKKIDALHESVDAFIDATLAMNQTVTEDSEKHRMAIIKYATNSYYSGSGSTDNVEQAVIGNNSNSSGYNYTQLVHDFTIVDSTGNTSLRNAANDLEAGGATAVDYGVELAGHILAERTPAEQMDRNAVVIVFSDGTPTHSNSYSSSVANTAISNALALKNSGVDVYTLSIFEGADGSVLGSDNTNQFMHYLSSNYPEAASMTNVGTGSPENGYYMTPDEESNISRIFERIMENIGTPKMSLSADTIVTDSISKYFDLTNEITPLNNIRLETITKTGPASGGETSYTIAPVTDPDIKANVNEGNKQITVTGFDFDANYITDTPKADGTYGKILRITINVTPNYDEIDDMSPKGGDIPTNLETAPARILNPAQAEPVAEVASPTVILNKVSYQTDGTSFADGAYDVYRLPGSDNKTIFNPTKEGYTFSGWSSTDATLAVDGSFTMPEGDVLISGTFAANTHNITYSYVGTVPTGVDPAYPDTLEDPDVAYGTPKTVAAAPDDVPAGYTFSGWRTSNAVVTGVNFNMPDSDVAFTGYFIANADTTFTIQHYHQNTDDDGYTLAEEYTDYGTTGTLAEASPKTYVGFNYNDTLSASTRSGIITGDGDLVLKLYYDRETYEITYRYEGDIPSSADPQDPSIYDKTGTNKVRYGATVEVAALPTYSTTDYEFHGWLSEKVSPTNMDTDEALEFTMPASDVLFEGHFAASGDTRYTVNHYLQNVDDDEYTLGLTRDDYTGAVGNTVTTVPLYFEGFIHNPAAPGTLMTGEIEEGGTLVLSVYYDREVHDVSYTYIGIVPKSPPQPTAPPDPALNNQTGIRFGATVTIADDITDYAGYKFVGWTSYGGTVKEDWDEFTMPNQDVELRGRFIPETDTAYTIQHWTQKRDGTYELKPENTENLTGTTGASVTALPKDIVGYTYTSSPVGETEVKEGIIKGDGSLVLKLYYTRSPLYSVTYLYTGAVPTGAPALPVTDTYIEGETVTVEVDPDVTGYNFIGWTSYGGTVDEDDESFAMPARDVTLSGRFEGKTTTYKIEHYLQTTGGVDAYTLDSAATETKSAKVGDEIVAVPKAYSGYTYSIDKTGNGYMGKALPNDGLTIKLYYDKIPYTVTYHYYGEQPEELVTAGTLPELPTDPGNKYAGEQIEIKNITVPAGYTFQGWYSYQVAIVSSDTKFDMPSNNVRLVGRLVANADTPYKVEHYTVSNGTTTLYQTDDLTGTTGTTVEAVPISISGYSYNSGYTGEVKSGVVSASTALVLKLYYTKNSSGGGGSTPSGYVEISKTVSAPDGVVDTGKAFSFDIMKESGSKQTKVKTVTVKSGESIKVSLSVGTYYIYEQEDSIDGYILKVNCDTADNKVEVKRSATSKISFENVYTSKENILEKDEHFAYIVGYPDGSVGPNESITRAEVATIFFRMMTDDARLQYRVTENPFSDVDKNDWFNIAVSTLANAKILDGYPDGTFGPDRPITRAELSKIAASFYKMQTSSEVDLSDISGHWAENFIRSAYNYGFINGYPDGTFKPDQYITRAETMKIVNAALERKPHKDYLLDDMIKWPDNADTAAWYYADVQEATNSHNYRKNTNYEVWKELRPVRDWAALEITE